MRCTWLVCAMIGVAAAVCGTAAGEGVLPNVSDPMLAASIDQRIENLALDAETAAKVRQQLKGVTEALNAWDQANAKAVADLRKDLAAAGKAGDQTKTAGVRAKLWTLIGQRDLLGQEKQEGLLGLLTSDQQEYWLTQDMYASTLAGAALAGETTDQATKVKMISMAGAAAGEIVILTKRTEKAKARDRHNNKRSKEFQDRERKRQAAKKAAEEEKKKKKDKELPDSLAPLVPQGGREAE